MRYHTLALSLGFSLLSGGCTGEIRSPTEPSISYGKTPSATGDGLRASFIQGDYTPAAGEVMVLTGAACTGGVERNFNIDFGTTDCLSLTTSSGVTLADDAYFGVELRKGVLSSLQFWIQDQSGPEGIGYASDKVTIAGQVPASGGFVLHVHRAFPVWRLSGHLSQKRVERVGTASIGDIVYF